MKFIEWHRQVSEFDAVNALGTIFGAFSPQGLWMYCTFDMGNSRIIMGKQTPKL